MPISKEQLQKHRAKLKVGGSKKKKRRLDVAGMRGRMFSGRDKFGKFADGATKLVFAMNIGEHEHNWAEPKVRFWLPNMDPDVDKQSIKIVSPKSVDEDAHCPAMQAYESLRNQGADDALLNDMKPSRRFLANAYLVDGKKLVHKVMELPQGVYDDVAAAIYAELGPEDFDEDTALIGEPPIVGYGKWRMVQVIRSGTGKFDTKYRVTVTGTAVKLSPELLAKRVDLLKVEPITPVAKIEKIIQQILGKVGDDSEDEDEKEVDFDDIFDDESSDDPLEVPDCIATYAETVKRKPKKCKACSAREDCKDF